MIGIPLNRLGNYPTLVFKGKGQPCQQGETAAKDGCIPANGVGSGNKAPYRPRKFDPNDKADVLEAVRNLALWTVPEITPDKILDDDNISHLYSTLRKLSSNITREDVIDSAKKIRDSSKLVAKNPNKPVNRLKPDPEREYKEKGIKAKAFKSWFGDWESDPSNASKIVNPSSGEPEKVVPLKVYHGVSAERFEEFDPKRVGSGTDPGNWGAGFYFTPDKEYAETYAKRDPKKGETLFEVYLNIRNPFEFTDKDYKGLEKESKIGNMLLDEYGEVSVDKWVASDKSVMSIIDEIGSKEFTKLLVKKGYDGAVEYNQNKKTKGVKKLIEVVAFNANQIKSVDNKGTFDPSSANIKKSYPTLVFKGKGKPCEQGETADKTAYAFSFREKSWSSTSFKVVEKGGFTGKKKDKIGRNICFKNGVHIPCNALGRTGAQDDKDKGKGKPTKTPKEKIAKVDPQQVVDKIKRLIDEPGKTKPEDVVALKDVLMTLTVNQINTLKKTIGVKASGKKAELAEKVATRALALRKEKPVEEAKPETKPEDTDDDYIDLKPQEEAKPEEDEDAWISSLPQIEEEPEETKPEEETPVAEPTEEENPKESEESVDDDEEYPDDYGEPDEEEKPKDLEEYLDYLKNKPDYMNQGGDKDVFDRTPSKEDLEAGKSNSRIPDESRPDLDYNEKLAIWAYLREGSNKLNTPLIEGESHTGKVLEAHKALQSAFAKARPFANPIHVERGMNIEDDETKAKFVASFKKAQETNSLVEIPGYLSTTTDEELIDQHFAGNFSFKIIAKQGLDVGPYEKFSEQELLLNHLSKFKVHSVEQNGDRYNIKLEQVLGDEEKQSK